MTVDSLPTDVFKKAFKMNYVSYIQPLEAAAKSKGKGKGPESGDKRGRDSDSPGKCAGPSPATKASRRGGSGTTKGQGKQDTIIPSGMVARERGCVDQTSADISAPDRSGFQAESGRDYSSSQWHTEGCSCSTNKEMRRS